MNFFRRTLFICTALLGGAHAMYAQSAADAFIHIPNSILPYTNQDLRDIACHRYTEMRNDSVSTEALVGIETGLGDTVIVKKLTDTHIEVELSQNSSIEIIVDTLNTPCLYTIRRYMAPATDVRIDKWTTDWKHIRTIEPQLSITDFLSPSLSTNEREEATALFDFPMYDAHWLATEHKIEFTISLPILTQEDKAKYSKFFINKQITLD